MTTIEILQLVEIIIFIVLGSVLLGMTISEAMRKRRLDRRIMELDEECEELRRKLEKEMEEAAKAGQTDEADEEEKDGKETDQRDTFE